MFAHTFFALQKFGHGEWVTEGGCSKLIAFNLLISIRLLEVHSGHIAKAQCMPFIGILK
jgi:hypothetical protein